MENSFDVLGQYAAGLIRRKARQLVRKAGLTESDREDVEQELATEVVRRVRNFDAERGSFEGTVLRIVNNAISDLLAARRAQCRDWRRNGPSLNAQVDDGEGGLVERAQTLDEEKYLRRTTRPEHVRRDLRFDVAQAVATLPPDLACVCETLGRLRPADAARELGMPRGTLYEAMARIRAHFRRVGLDRY